MTLKLLRNRINIRSQYTVLCSLLVAGTGSLLYGINETIKYVDQIVNPRVLKLSKSTQYIYINYADLEMDYDEKLVGRKMEWSVSQWWERRKKLFLWRLVEIANLSEDKDRKRAVQTLASYNTLHDYEYYELALACNANTLVSLARVKGADKRFFCSTRCLSKRRSHQEIVNSMQDLLVKLSKLSSHPCLYYFLSKVFPKLPKYKAWSYVSDLDIYGFFSVPPSSISDDIVLPLCVEALLHHCIVIKDAKAMVETGALQLLFDCHNELSSDYDSCYKLSSIIAEISTHPEFLQDIFQTGWVTVMAKWIQGRDKKLSIAAATTLANLDRDIKPSAKYQKEVVLLHPSYHSKEAIAVDVVLIHGLLGGVYYTWRQRGQRREQISIFGIANSEEPLMDCAKTASLVIDEAPQEIPDLSKEDSLLESEYVFVMSDIPETESYCCNTTCSIEGSCLSELNSLQNPEYTTCWPGDWLPQDCKNLRVLGINYDTHITYWTNWCPLRDKRSERRLAERCKKLLSHLIDCGIGERPIIWITHSMGGLVLKHLLMLALNNPDEKLQKVCENTKGAVFLSTPHIGSPWASWHEAWKFFAWTSTEVDELQYQSPVLQKLHKEFLKFVDEHPMEIVSFVETRSMKISEFEWEFHCVPPHIGDTGTGIIYGVPLSHLEICKPDGKFSFIYQRILSLVRSIAEKSVKQKPITDKSNKPFPVADKDSPVIDK